MNWNPFKRIAQLEGTIARLDSVVHRMMQANSERSDRIADLEKRLKEINVQANPVAAMTMGEFKKAKLREYARARYARKKAEKLAAKEQA
jgi:septal ring factor EnvC (AmiA/AmiB activator)